MDGGLLSTTIALAVVCALAIGALRAASRRAPRARGMRVVSRLAVEPRRSLLVVEVAGRWFLVGAGEGPMSLVAELDAAEARAHLEAAPPSAPATARSAFAAAGGNRTHRRSFASALRRVLGGARGDQAR